MKEELEEKLAREFEFMRYKELSEDGSFCSILLNIEDGWYQLVYNMCEEIAKVLETAESPIQIEIEEINEKWGTMRVVYYLGPLEAQDQEIDASDLMNTHIALKNNDVFQKHMKINEIIQKYEIESAEVCENCGGKGTVRRDLDWVTTLCDTCHSEYVKKHH